MKAYVIGERILVEPEQVSEKVGNIIIPDKSKVKPTTGTVVGVSGGILVDGMWEKVQVSVGDKVYFSQYDAVEITLNNKKLFVIKQSDVLCAIPKDCKNDAEMNYFEV